MNDNIIEIVWNKAQRTEGYDENKWEKFCWCLDSTMVSRMTVHYLMRFLQGIQFCVTVTKNSRLVLAERQVVPGT